MFRRRDRHMMHIRIHLSVCTRVITIITIGSKSSCINIIRIRSNSISDRRRRSPNIRGPNIGRRRMGSIRRCNRSRCRNIKAVLCVLLLLLLSSSSSSL